MPNTLSILAQISDQTQNLSFSRSATVTTTGNALDARLISVGTSEEQHVISTEITASAANGPGVCFIWNKDATNYVEIGFATTVYPIKLLKGEAILLRLNAAETDLFLKANTAACNVLIAVYEA